jgi:hypothetical protein
MDTLPPEIINIIIQNDFKVQYNLSMTSKRYYKIASKYKQLYIYTIIYNNLPKLISELIINYCLCLHPSDEYLKSIYEYFHLKIISLDNINKLFELILPVVNTLQCIKFKTCNECYLTFNTFVSEYRINHMNKINKLINDINSIFVYPPTVKLPIFQEVLTGIISYHEFNYGKYFTIISSFILFIIKLIIRHYKKITKLKDLPNELILNSIMKSNPKTYVSLSKTCKKYYQLAKSNHEEYSKNLIICNLDYLSDHLIRKYSEIYYFDDRIKKIHLQTVKKELKSTIISYDPDIIFNNKFLMIIIGTIINNYNSGIIYSIVFDVKKYIEYFTGKNIFVD